MSTELVGPSEAVPIRVLMYDGSTAQTGIAVYISIERVSDGKYWDGNNWQVAYGTLGMTELSGNAHLAGVYQYTFVLPAAPDRFDWRVTYNGASFDRAFAGRINSRPLSVNITEIEGQDATDQINAACDMALADYGANTTTPPTALVIADTVWNSDLTTYENANTAPVMIRGISTMIGTTPVLHGNNSNTLLGLVQAIARSDAILPTAMGGTFDPTTDSLQAVRDRGDAGWTSGSGGSGFEM